MLAPEHPHGFMHDYQRQRSREQVGDFVERVLGEGRNGDL